MNKLGMQLKSPLEPFTRLYITDTLKKLGYELNEQSPDCNIFQERAKTLEQNKLLNGKKPDFTVYQSGTNRCIAVIEAKKPDISIDTALDQAINLYAIPLKAPVVFITNKNYTNAYSIDRKPLKIDNVELQEFVDEKMLLNFINNNFEIQSVPRGIAYTREELLSVFKEANELLRKAGLREGYERFSVFSDILFLKLKNDYDDYGTVFSSNIDIEKSCNWTKLINKLPDNNSSYSSGDVKDYLIDTIKPRLREKYGDVFDNALNINDEQVLIELIKIIDSMDFSNIDSDVKGDAFEFFLRNVTNGNKDLGEYYTPRHIVKMIVKIINPKYGQKIYDPCCGTGGFLLECFKHLINNSNIEDEIIKDNIRRNSIFGRELTSTSRTAKMNMILFGDGHSNIVQMDSLSQPINEKYDIVLSNIPFSQPVDNGALYDFNSNNGDSVFTQHMWKATKKGGTMAVIVQDTFFYSKKEDDCYKCRKWIIDNSSDLVVISLPRGVFNPYTPTKTSILIAKKRTEREEKENVQLKKCYFYVIRNDGFELGQKRRPLNGTSDCAKLLLEYSEKCENRITNLPNSINVDILDIINNNYSLFPFDYMEHLPEDEKDTKKLMNSIIERNDKFNYDDNEEKTTECAILSVTKNGIYISDTYTYDEMKELKQTYKRVYPGDITYNPHRINIGSIGVVPNIHPNMYVSNIYPVFYISDSDLSPYYIVNLLKQKKYRNIINDYCLGGARANLTIGQLSKIHIKNPSQEENLKYRKLSKELNLALEKYLNILREIQ